MRPGYVPELYEDIFNYITIDKTSNVLEVGIGGGQATLPILKTGCKLTAVEYGENFVKLCRQKFKEFSTFSTVTAKEYISLLGTYSDHIAKSIPEKSSFQKLKKRFIILAAKSLYMILSIYSLQGNHNILLLEYCETNIINIEKTTYYQ